MLTVNIVVRSGGGVSEEKIRVPPTPVGLAHIPQGASSIIRYVNIVEKGEEGICQAMSWKLPVVGEGVIKPVSAIDCAVNVRGEGIVV